jgi:hypothetical protein
MSIMLNGYEVLRRIGSYPDTFAKVRVDVDKQARALVVKCLKHKSSDLAAQREIFRALGQEHFGLVVEGLKDSEVKTILTRLDKHHPDVKGGTSAWRNQHFKALAEGTAHPSDPPAKPAKKSKVTKKEPKPERPRLQSEVMEVFRQGGKDKS